MRRNLILCFALVQSLAFGQQSPGERLAYVVGCINCHHQTPKEIINAPPLLVVKGYTKQEFQRLLKTGVAKSGRDMLAQSSIMGIVAKEQFSHMNQQEMLQIYEYLTTKWTAERATTEEEKIPSLYRAHMQPAQPAK